MLKIVGDVPWGASKFRPFCVHDSDHQHQSHVIESEAAV